MSTRLAVIATHPIQYSTPLFRLLTARPGIDLHVFYGWHGAANRTVQDPGFGRQVQWDVPLLDGYDHTFVPNVAARPGTDHFGGLDNPELVPRVRAWGPDAVLVLGWAWKSHLAALRALHGRLPVLFRGDSTMLDQQAPLRRLIRRRWLRWVYRHVDVALYVGMHNRAYFRFHGLRDEQLVWAPHAVDNDRFADPGGVLAAEAGAWRERLGIADDAVVFLFAGKLVPKKDPETLLTSFLALDGIEAHLVFIGSGPLEASLRTRASGHRRIHFLGFQNQSRMPVAYRLGDVMVLPSRGPGETWGLAVNEAMASCRPVIVSDRAGCAPDLVASEMVGRIVPTGRVDTLTSCMAEIAAHPLLRTAMRDAAAAAIRDWSPQRLADAVVHALGQCTRT